MIFSLEGKTAIVTGSSRGIGKAIAFSLAESGANVVLNGTADSTEISSTFDEFRSKGFNVAMHKGNVNMASSADQLINTALENFGNIHILVNNAGITKDKLLIKMSEEDWDAVLDINLKGTFLCTKSVIRHMTKQKYGRILNVASVVGLIGNAGQSNYVASKAGIIGFTKSIAREFARKNITCNAIAPGFISTNMTDKLNEQTRQDYINKIPLGRLGTSEDVSHIAVSLVSDIFGYVTGQVINIDGGMVMY